MTSRFQLRTAALALATAFSLALAGPAAAQSADSNQSAQSQQSGQQSGQQQTPNYSEEKLQSFAAAAAKMSSVVREYRPQLRQAQKDGNRQQFQQLQREAKQAMDQKIASTEGISSKEYQQIAQAAQQDKQLRQKVLAMMKAQQGEQQSQ